MTTPRKQRCDSTAALVRAAQGAALGPIKPPAHVNLRDGDLVFWNAVMMSRARDSWNDSDLVIAANLARSQADIEMLQKDIDSEGYLDDKGKISGKATLVEVLTKRIVSLSRLLQVHATATLGDSENAHKSLALDKKARAAEVNDLIPRMLLVG